MGVPLRHLSVLVTVVAVVGILLVYKTRPMLVEPSIPVAQFGVVSLRIEYATTSEARERGLGGRTEIPKDYGMLFVFQEDGLYAFWMKDMLVPIDIFWLDSDRHVVSIAQDVATSTYPNVFYPLVPVRYVLETAAGFARAHSVIVGTSLLLKNIERVTE